MKKLVMYFYLSVMIFTIYLSTFFVMACKSQKLSYDFAKVPDSKDSLSYETNDYSSNLIPYDEIVDKNKLPENVQAAILENRVQKKHNVFYLEENKGYVLITSGEKRTGGYGIEVVSVQNINNTTKITVKETSPGIDDMVTMAFTYPYTVVKINNLKEKVFVERVAFVE